MSFLRELAKPAMYLGYIANGQEEGALVALLKTSVEVSNRVFRIL